MPIAGPKHSFKEVVLMDVLDKSGVYALWDEHDLIYFGKSHGSVRGRLLAHKMGYHGEDTKNAVSFQFEITDHPDSREIELLEEYRRLHGHLPRCNEFVARP